MASKFELRRFVEFGRKIVAVGRNYRDHAIELGNPVPEKPLIFFKPSTSYLRPGGEITFPPGCQDLHHEVELGVVIGKSGKDIGETDAMDHVGGYALALDMTARDFQQESKKKGLPWTIAKGFDTATPISDFIPKSAIPDPNNVRLWLKVDEAMRQDGNTSEMIFKIPFLVSFISRYMTLEEGDLILTGTPSGVSAVQPGQTITTGLGELLKMSFTIIKAC